MNSKGKEYKMQGIDLKGFSLVELLIVITIIIILTAIALVVYRDLSAEARDAARVTDLASIVDAVQLATHDAVNPVLALCVRTTAPCRGASYPLGGSTRNTDGTGWVLVNFDAFNIATFNQLPVDPLNNATYFYTYESDGQHWRVSVPLESAKYASLMSQDGGKSDSLYEVGVGIKSF